MTGRTPSTIAQWHYGVDVFG